MKFKTGMIMLGFNPSKQGIFMTRNEEINLKLNHAIATRTLREIAINTTDQKAGQAALDALNKMKEPVKSPEKVGGWGCAPDEA